MIFDIGYLILITAFVLAAFGMILGYAGARRRQNQFVQSVGELDAVVNIDDWRVGICALCTPKHDILPRLNPQININRVLFVVQVHDPPPAQVGGYDISIE